MINRKTGAGRKALGWALLLSVSITITGQAAIGRRVPAGGKRARARITLRVYNYAISHTLLSDAEREATVILNHAGVEAAWIDCALVPADFENYPACKRSIGPADFILKVVSKEETRRFSKHHDALGEALQCSKDQGGCTAYVFYRDIQGLAAAGGADDYQLLGHIMAHEIGHLLLGPSHALTGVMRARYSYEDLQAIAGNYLFFGPRESRRMRSELLARNTQTLSAVSTAPPPQPQTPARITSRPLKVYKPDGRAP